MLTMPTLTLVARRITTINTKIKQTSTIAPVSYFDDFSFEMMKNLPTENGFSYFIVELHLHRTKFDGRRQMMAVMWVSQLARNDLRSLILSEQFLDEHQAFE